MPSSRLQSRFELGYRLEQIRYQPVVGYLEDRCIAVIVDRDDNLAFFHTRQVLDRTGYTDRDVQIGRDYLAGLAHLVFIRHESRVYRGP